MGSAIELVIAASRGKGVEFPNEGKYDRSVNMGAKNLNTRGGAMSVDDEGKECTQLTEKV